MTSIREQAIARLRERFGFSEGRATAIYDHLAAAGLLRDDQPVSGARGVASVPDRTNEPDHAGRGASGDHALPPRSADQHGTPITRDAIRRAVCIYAQRGECRPAVPAPRGGEDAS